MINAKHMIFRGCLIHGWILDRSTVCETWDVVELDTLRLKLLNFIQIYLSYTLVLELFLRMNLVLHRILLPSSITLAGFSAYANNLSILETSNEVTEEVSKEIGLYEVMTLSKISYKVASS